MTATRNRPSGFDYLRIALSISVIAYHSFFVCYGPEGERPYWFGVIKPFWLAIVPAFFSLSGFLVASSFERNNLTSFLTLRVLRLFPALVVEVVVSALIIGLLFTNLTTSQYFLNSHFWKYFLNMIGYIHYDLPGVFVGLPDTNRVNLQLWTIPFELECYLSICVIGIVGLYKFPKFMLTALTMMCLAIFSYQLIVNGWTNGMHRSFARMIVICFLFAVFLYALRKSIPYSMPLFVASVILSCLSLNYSQTAYLSPLPVSYMTVFIGLQNPRRMFLLKGADYSYGIYLYGYPVQQSIVSLFPHLRVWWFNLPASLVVSGAIAYVSWTFVESRVLNRKKTAVQHAERWSTKIQGLFRSRDRGPAICRNIDGET